jgi:hypothetical protein
MTPEDRKAWEERIEPRISRAGWNDCWLWTGSLVDGYGQVSLPTGGKWKAHRVHRLSWEYHIGPIPEGMHVCHKCDVRSCVRPDHLFLGDIPTNNRDMVKKGRNKIMRGENNGNSKVTPEAVEYIRRNYKRYKKGSSVTLSKMFGICRYQVVNIAQGKYWNV